MPDLAILSDNPQSRAQMAVLLRLIEARAIMRMTLAEAAAFAGVSFSTAQKWLKDTRVKKYITQMQQEQAEKLDIKREQVVQGFLDAIRDGRMMNDAQAQIAGWREIAKMQGYYAPEKRELTLPKGAKKFVQALESMDDHKLLELAGIDTNIIDVTPQNNG